MDDLGVISEESQMEESKERQKYRSNSHKLTTLVELATMEDLSETESPPKKAKKSRHKKAQPS